MITLLDHVGYFGPLILLLSGIYILRNRSVYIMTYFLGFVLCEQLNRLLKSIIREPRPDDAIHYTDHDDYTRDTGSNKYGMPSGHAQLVFYCVGFLYSATDSVRILFGTTAISLLTLFQRWKFRKHSAKQLLAGSILGIVTGFGAYTLTKWGLMSNLYTVPK